MSESSKARRHAAFDSSRGIFARRRTFTIAEFLGIILVLLVVWFAGRIILMTFGGVLLAVLLNTLAHGLSRLTRIPYGWALGIVVLSILALAGTTFWLVGSWLVSQANELSQALPRSLKQIRDYLDEYPWGKWILEQSPEWGRSFAQGSIPSRITDLGSAIIDMGVAFVIMIFVGLYCAAEPQLYADGLIRLVPLDRRERAREVFRAVVDKLRWWLMGQMFAMVCVGIISGVGLWIAGAPLALTLGLLAALLEIVPSVGPVLWLVPALMVALTQGTTQVVHVLIVYAVTHAIESYLLIPLVQRRAVLLPPTVSILAVVLLGLLAGFLGLLVAAPMALVVMVLVRMLYVEDRLGDHSPTVD